MATNSIKISKRWKILIDNELLKYAKSVRYLETGNYKAFLRFPMLSDS